MKSTYTQPDKEISFKSYLGHKAFIVSVVAIACSFLLLAVAYYWLLTPVQPLVIQKQPTVRTKVVHPGDTVIFDYQFCKVNAISGYVDPQLVGRTVASFLPSYPENLPKGCTDDLPVPIILPEILPPDTYHIHYKVTYRVNPLTTKVVEWDTQAFTVTSR